MYQWTFSFTQEGTSTDGQIPKEVNFVETIKSEEIVVMFMTDLKHGSG